MLTSTTKAPPAAAGEEATQSPTRLHPDDLAALITGIQRVSSPWLSAASAAAYLDCPVSRIRKLTMTGDLPVHREGRRVLYRREDLDEFVRGGGAITG